MTSEWDAFLRAFEAPVAPEAVLGSKGQGKPPPDASRALLKELTPRFPENMPDLFPEDHRSLHAPQQAFLLLDDREAFYGGAAGGGKSEALLKSAAQFVDYPHYRALVLRRTYPELAMPGAIMERAKSWWAGRTAKWVADDHQMEFPSGASITFAHMQNDADAYRFGGTEFHAIFFDELTRFSEWVYRFMFSRLRKTADDPIPLRMRSASNPGDVGHEWVKRHFVDPGDAARPFIPAKVQDNPSLNIAEYLESLANLDPVTRKRLLDGDWDVTGAGGFFKRTWYPIVPAVAGHLRRVVRYWDLAASVPTASYPDPDWTRGAKMGLTFPDADSKGIYYGMNMQSIRADTGERDLLIKQTAMIDGRKVPVLFEQEPGSAGKAQIVYFQKLLPGWTVRGIKSTGDKEVRAGPFASQSQAGNVRLVEGPWVEEFLNEADVFPTKGVHDDTIDAMSGAFEALSSVASGKLVSW
jgi:predicted phage terminase large subunit-like protein